MGLHRAPEHPRRFASAEAIVVTVLGAATLLLFVVRRDGTTQLVSNLLLLFMALAAAGACFLRANRTTPETRKVWLCFAASVGCWGIGQAVWSWYEQVADRPLPFPSAADVGYLLAIPFAIAALLLLPVGHGARYGRARVASDGMVIAASLVFIVWVFVLERALHANYDSWQEHVLGMAYPIGDTITITIALSLLAASWRSARIPAVTLLMLLGAAVCLAVADTGFFYLGLVERYVSGHPIDIAWYFGFGLLYLAARRPVTAPDKEHEPGLPRAVSVATPYVAVLAAILVATYKRLSDGSLGDAGFAMLIAVMTLLVARQYLAIVENGSLAKTLDDRVRARTAELRSNEERFRSLVQHSSDVVTIVDREGIIRYQSPSVTTVFGYDPAPLVDTPLWNLVLPQDRALLAEVFAQVSAKPAATKRAEFELRHADGAWRRCEATVTNLLHVPSVAGLVLNASDITTRKFLEDQLVHQAFHDSLTTLANRALVHDRLQQALIRARRSARSVAVLYCDLDNFKAINDTLGHTMGDRLLVKVAERLLTCVRPTDTVARLGGDEFAILLEDATGETEAFAVATRIQEALRAPIALDGRDVFVSASAGIAVSNDEDDTADSLISEADMAMYRAKARGVGGYERFHVAMRPTADAIDLDTDLHHALARDELVVYYQPIIALETGRVAGMEALLRWKHPARGIVSPDDFIPMAERSGLILDIGRWVLEQACAQTAELQRGGLLDPHAFVSVNLSGRHVQSPGLVADVTRALDASELPPANLLLEMTESVLIEHSGDTLETLKQLKRRGPRLAIDDFGTGYSSLSYVHRLPVDVLKIDQSFIERMDDDSRVGLAEWIVRIGHALGFETVAEGIEDQEQLVALRDMHCELGQGFHLARPVPFEQLAGHLGPTAMPAHLHGRG